MRLLLDTINYNSVLIFPQYRSGGGKKKKLLKPSDLTIKYVIFTRHLPTRKVSRGVMVNKPSEISTSIKLYAHTNNII